MSAIAVRKALISVSESATPAAASAATSSQPLRLVFAGFDRIRNAVAAVVLVALVDRLRLFQRCGWHRGGRALPDCQETDKGLCCVGTNTARPQIRARPDVFWPAF